jgi:hypothetical protein
VPRFLSKTISKIKVESMRRSTKNVPSEKRTPFRKFQVVHTIVFQINIHPNLFFLLKLKSKKFSNDPIIRGDIHLNLFFLQCHCVVVDGDWENLNFVDNISHVWRCIVRFVCCPFMHFKLVNVASVFALFRQFLKIGMFS